MPLPPAMRARSEYVGRFIREHHPKGSGKIPAHLFKEAHAAFSREHPEHVKAKSNPSERDGDSWYFEEEVETAAIGTVVGLTAFALIAAAICGAARRAQAQQQAGSG